MTDSARFLEGKVAVVTGAGRGLGRGYALTLSKYGASVVINDTGQALNGAGVAQSPADEAVKEIVAAGGKAVPNYDSVATPDGAEGIIKTALESFGRLDILINNAGILRDRMIYNLSDDEWDAVIKVHLYGTFYCTRNACRIMKEQGFGRIINTSSLSGLGRAGQSNYAAAKEGIIGFTRSIARELYSHGITCNAIRPRAATRMTLSPELYEARKKRYGVEEADAWRKKYESRTVEDVATLVVYLASPGAQNINGCVFDIYGSFIAIYEDPPLIKRIITKKTDWLPEELMEVIPQTLALGLKPNLPPRCDTELSAQAQGWELDEGELKPIKPFILQ